MSPQQCQIWCRTNTRLSPRQILSLFLLKRPFARPKPAMIRRTTMKERWKYYLYVGSGWVRDGNDRKCFRGRVRIGYITSSEDEWCYGHGKEPAEKVNRVFYKDIGAGTRRGSWGALQHSEILQARVGSIEVRGLSRPFCNNFNRWL